MSLRLPLRQIAKYASLLTLAGVSACSDSEHGGAPTDPSAEGHDSRYAVRAVVDGRVLRFGGPIDGREDQTTPMSAQNVRVPGNEGKTSSEAIDARYLLWTAASECGAYNGNYSSGFGLVNPFPDAAKLAELTWVAPAWYIFKEKSDPSGRANFDSCDDILFHEEVLLCTASKLDEIASAAKPLVWDNVGTRPSWFPAQLKKPIILPPQRNQDRFIVRDLALNVLAHLARLDLQTPQALGQTTCAHAYAAAASSGNAQTKLFGVIPNQAVPEIAPYFLPLSTPVTTANIPTLAGARLEHQTKILREAGVLLKHPRSLKHRKPLIPRQFAIGNVTV